MGYGTTHHLGWLLFCLATLVVQGVVALRIVGLLTTGNLQAVAVTPALYLPPLALAGAVIEVVRRGHWPPLVGGVARALACTVTAFLALKTAVLIAQGRLIPAPPPG